MYKVRIFLHAKGYYFGAFVSDFNRDRALTLMTKKEKTEAQALASLLLSLKKFFPTITAQLEGRGYYDKPLFFTEDALMATTWSVAMA